MRATGLASALAAFAAAQPLGASPLAPPRGTVRVVIDADPTPAVDLKELPPAVAALLCPAKDKACAGEGARAVSEARGWVETPPVDVQKMIADCADRSRVAMKFGNGLAAFRSCLWYGRQSVLWLPAAGFRLPRKGWFAFSWSTPGECANGNNGCFTTGLLDLATGAIAVRQEESPIGDDEPPRIETITGDVSLGAARASVLLALLGPHAVRRRVAIAADVPPELAPAGSSVVETPRRDLFIQSVVSSERRYRWAWLSPTGKAWAKGGESSSAALGNLISGHLHGLPDTLVPGCPTSRPPMDPATIRAALDNGQDVAPIAELRAAFGQCHGARTGVR